MPSISASALFVRFGVGAAAERLWRRLQEMLEKNPAGGLPFIELKNGTCIAETVAIAAYLEDAESTNGKKFDACVQRRVRSPVRRSSV